MQRNRSITLSWSWWLRSGERLSLGLGLKQVLDGSGANLNKQALAGLDVCRQHVEEGFSLVESLKRSGVKLDIEAWCLLTAGEKTGKMGESMIEVGNLLRDLEERKRELIGQIWYPLVVLMTGFLVMLIILLWVVPQMRDISQSMGQGTDMPWLTEHIGKIYGLIFAGTTILLSLLSCAWSLTGYYARQSLKMATWREYIVARIPVFGSLRFTRREARIFRQLAILIKGGITLPEALGMASSSSPDQYECQHLLELRKRLLMGISFTDSIRVSRLVREWNVPLLITGQESGQLDTYLFRLASDLDREVSWKLKQVLRVIEPVTILSLAIMVTGMVLAYLLPTIRMLEQLA